MAVSHIYAQPVDLHSYSVITRYVLKVFRCYLNSSVPLSVGSIGDLVGGEDNLPDDVSLSGEEAGASDQDDSAECDGSSPSFAPLYNEGKMTIIKSNDFVQLL